MTNIKSNVLKVLLFLVIMQFIFAIGNVSHAEGEDANAEKGFWEGLFESGSGFLEEGKSEASDGQISIPNQNGESILGVPKTESLLPIINDIYNVVFPLGLAITVIVGGVMGIKFMMSSVEDRAKIKESLVPYAVGCVVIYGAFAIWKLAITIFSQIG